MGCYWYKFNIKDESGFLEANFYEKNIKLNKISLGKYKKLANNRKKQTRFVVNNKEIIWIIILSNSNKWTSTYFISLKYFDDTNSLTVFSRLNDFQYSESYFRKNKVLYC